MTNPRDRHLSDVEIEWVDSGREPQCAPDPAYPNGIVLDVSEGATKTCDIELPYPAKRCGTYRVRCTKCGLAVGITTAGRRDDPRGAKLGCYSQVMSTNGRTKIVTHPKKSAYPHSP